MRKLFPKTFLATWIAVGALCAGAPHAQVVDFVQVNLVSDIPGLATITDSRTRETLGGVCAQHHEPLLDLEPRD